MKKNKAPIDPLYQLFEHNLFNRSYDDIASFTKELAEEYLAYLDSTNAHVPFGARSSILKDLEAEAHEMLIKKMYGCAKSGDYTNFGSVMSLIQEEEAMKAENNGQPRAKKKKTTPKTS